MKTAKKNTVGKVRKAQALKFLECQCLLQFQKVLND